MKINLNYDWTFCPINTSQKEKVNLPHTVELLPYSYFDEKIYQNIYIYEKEINLEKIDSNCTYILSFAGFMVQADIFINEQNVGHFISGYLPIKINIDEYIKIGNNLIKVVLDGKEDPNIPPFGYAIDYLTFAGLYREVYLEVKPKIYLNHLHINASKDGDIEIKPFIKNEKSEEYTLKYEIYDGDELVYQGLENKFKITNPKTWDIASPYLYKARAILTSKYGVDELTIKFGCRNIEFKKNGFYLNGRHVKLIGLNRHQSYPYIGYAAPKSLQIDDANILKYTLGVNVVRTSHYPQSEHFLARCDEIGLLVINEIPGWQHIGKNIEWRNNYYDFVKRMVMEQFNHPSLIAHGVRIDESMDDHELYLKGNAIAHEIDKTRPTLGVRNFKNSELLEDIYAYNDFFSDNLTKGLIPPRKIKTRGKPYLVTEYLGHMYPTKKSDSAPRKLTHALRHAKVIDDNFKYDRIAGAIGWCFADYYTHVDFGSGDHVCPHGVMDAFRLKKPAASIYSSQQNDFLVFDVLTNLKPGDNDEAIFGPIFIATNVDYIKLFRNDKYVATFYPKRNRFKYMPHPPIEINDLIGETFLEENYSSKEKRRVAKLLSYVAINGFAHLKIKHYLRLLPIVIRHHLKYADLVDLFNTYVASWGGKANNFRFDGYKDDQKVISKTYGPSLQFHYEIEQNKDCLTLGETYDIMKLTIRHLNQNGNLAEYSTTAFTITASEEIRILGPSHLSLLGGETTIYLANKFNKIGVGKVTIQSDNFLKEITIPIK